MTRRAITTEGAPGAVGPYSQAIATDTLLFCSGQAALDPATGALVEGGIEPETERVMANLDARSSTRPAAAGRTCVKTTIFLVDMADFAAVNAIYGRFMARSAARPARRSGSPPCRRAPGWRSSSSPQLRGLGRADLG